MTTGKNLQTGRKMKQRESAQNIIKLLTHTDTML